MKTHQFTLYIDGPSEITDEMEDALYKARCSDGMLGIQNGSLFIDFIRKAPTLLKAVMSAVKQIEKAIPGAKVSGLKPSPFLTQSELAKVMDVSREYVRLLTSGQRGAGGFPAPVMSSRKRLYWDVSNVLEWYSKADVKAGNTDLRNAKDLVTLFLALEIRNNRDEYQRALEIIRELDAVHS